MSPETPSPRNRSLWVSTTYFAEGLPLSLVRNLATVYFTAIGLKEAYLGFLNFLGLPWNAKFLWAPLVDLVGTKRGWLLRVEASLAVGFALIAVLAEVGPPVVTQVLDPGATGTGSEWIPGIIALLVVLAFTAATHDIAIDAYFMEAITGAREQAAYTGLRVLTYRIAVIFTKSGLVALAGWVSWTAGFLGGAATLGALVLFHAWYLPRVETPRAPGGRPLAFLHDYGRAFSSWLEQPRILLILAFVVTYKLGDEVLFSMQTPFLLRELGVAQEQYAWINGIVGTTTSIAGSLLSAWAVQRWGLRRAVWPLTLAMNINIWAYIWLAWAHPDPSTLEGLATVAGVHAYEQFAAGLGNAVLMVFIMRTCVPRFKAAHYAIASAISSLGGTVFGGFGGVIVEQVGYVGLYLLAFAAALPSMACLLVLKMPDDA